MRGGPFAGLLTFNSVNPIDSRSEIFFTFAKLLTTRDPQNMSKNRKLLFAQAKHQGLNLSESAIMAGYSKDSARQAGSRLAKDDEVIGHLNALQREKSTTKKAVERLTPLEYMLKVLNNMDLDDRTRLDAAKAAAPYVHARASTAEDQPGKKQQRDDRAKISHQNSDWADLLLN